jgi:hypothetical protein
MNELNGKKSQVKWPNPFTRENVILFLEGIDNCVWRLDTDNKCWDAPFQMSDELFDAHVKDIKNPHASITLTYTSECQQFRKCVLRQVLKCPVLLLSSTIRIIINYYY